MNSIKGFVIGTYIILVMAVSGKPHQYFGVEAANGRTRRLKTSSAEVRPSLPRGSHDPNSSDPAGLLQKFFARVVCLCSGLSAN